MKSLSSERLKTFPELDDVMARLAATFDEPVGVIREYREVMALARAFNDEVVRPYASALSRDATLFPVEFVEAANRWGLYSLWIPRIFGGRGYPFFTVCLFLEELASACASMAHLVGVHYLGIATLFSGWNAEAAARICREVVEGERKGRPCLVSLAFAEPEVSMGGEGSGCRARRVAGGYSLTGSQVFVANGHLSTWYMLFAPEESPETSSRLALLAVKRGGDGFFMERGGVEKEGHSELIFDGYFVDEGDVLLDPRQVQEMMTYPMEAPLPGIDYIVSASRAGICAFGSGVARGAFEAARAYAESTKVGGVKLVEQGWVRSLLAKMYKNVSLSRLAYLEANDAIGLYRMYRLLQIKPLYYLMRWCPKWLMGRVVVPLASKWIDRWSLARGPAIHQEALPASDALGWVSLVGCAGTDAGVKNGQLALSLLGDSGAGPDAGMEKQLRDARFMQAHEGIHQRACENLFKCFIGDSLHREEAVWDLNIVGGFLL